MTTADHQRRLYSPRRTGSLGHHTGGPRGRPDVHRAARAAFAVPKPATGRSLSLGTPVDPHGDRPALDASREDLWRPAPSFLGLNRGAAPASMFMGRVV